jgi:hypothetical protein
MPSGCAAPAAPSIAEVQAEALAAVVTENIATKQDLRELEYRLTLRLGAMLTVAAGTMAALAKLP